MKIKSKISHLFFVLILFVTMQTNAQVKAGPKLEMIYTVSMDEPASNISGGIKLQWVRIKSSRF